MPVWKRKTRIRSSATDVVGSLMASVTTIVNLISYVLIAFVAISLVVSSIMIGVITYISVLERKKEIGILRAIGASKKNVSQVFNAETFIIGALARLMRNRGYCMYYIYQTNSIIHTLAQSRGRRSAASSGCADPDRVEYYPDFDRWNPSSRKAAKRGPGHSTADKSNKKGKDSTAV